MDTETQKMTEEEIQQLKKEYGRLCREAAAKLTGEKYLDFITELKQNASDLYSDKIDDFDQEMVELMSDPHYVTNRAWRSSLTSVLQAIKKMEQGIRLDDLETPYLGRLLWFVEYRIVTGEIPSSQHYPLVQGYVGKNLISFGIEICEITRPE